MSTAQMRVALEKKYNKKFADKLSDQQVVATYMRLKRTDKI